MVPLGGITYSIFSIAASQQASKLNVFCDEYKAIQEAMTGEKPLIAVQIRQNKFIERLKGDNASSRNTWAKLACLLPYAAGMPTAEDALIWWNAPSRKATLSATPPTYIQEQGFTGIPASQTYIDTGFNPTADGGTLYTQNNCSNGIWYYNNRILGADYASGLYNTGSGNPGVVLITRLADGKCYVRIQGAFEVIDGGYDSNKLFIGVRLNATQHQLFIDGIGKGLANANSTSLANETIPDLCAKIVGSNRLFYTSDTVGLRFFGSGLDQIDIDIIKSAWDELIYGIDLFVELVDDIDTFSYSETYSQQIALIDSYTTNYNGIVNKVNIGKDGSGTYDMFAYEFIPSSYQYTALFTSGAHGDEPYSKYASIEFIRRICNHTGGDFIEYMAENYRIFIIPIINPYGFENSQRYPYDGVDISANFDYCWDDQTYNPTKKGIAPFSISETQNIKTYFKSKTGIDWYLACHDFSNKTLAAEPGYQEGMQYAFKTEATNYINDWIAIVKSGGSFSWADYGLIGFEVGYIVENYGIPGYCSETSRASDYWLSDSVRTIRAVELMLCGSKVLHNAVKKVYDSIYYDKCIAPSFYSYEFGKLDTSYADIIAKHNTASVIYDLDGTDVYKIVIGSGEKKVLVVGVTNTNHDQLTIHGAINQILSDDKPATIQLLNECNITFIPSANPKNTTISNWDAGLEEEVTDLKAFIGSGSFDYIIAVNRDETVGGVLLHSDSFTTYLTSASFVTRAGKASGELQYTSGLTMYLRNKLTGYDSIKHGYLIIDWMKAIINSIASWNYEN